MREPHRPTPRTSAEDAAHAVHSGIPADLAQAGDSAHAEGPAAPTAEPRLRRMRWWDIDRVAELDSVLFGEDTWSPEFFWSQLASPVARMTLAVEPGDDLCGYVGVSVSGGQADILTIGTAPRVQGRGLGRRLLEHAADTARDAGAEVLHLDVAADNEPALRLYRRHGFSELGRRAGYYAGADAILMRAFL